MPEDLAVLTQDLSPLADSELAGIDAAHCRVERIGGTQLLRATCFGQENDVDDAAVRALQPIADHIAELGLGRTRVTDAVAATLAKCTRLLSLDLRETEAGDACARAAAALPHLQSLNLFGSKVTDQGAAMLAGCASLRQLYLWQTAVSAPTVVALGEKLPKTRIVFAPDLPEPGANEGGGRRRRGGK